MVWRGLVVSVVLLGLAQGNGLEGFVQNLEGWKGPKVINTQYPGTVSLVRVDSGGNAVAVGQLSSNQGGRGGVPFMVRYTASGVLAWGKALAVDDFELDNQGNIYTTTTLTNNAAIAQSCEGFSRAYQLGKYSPEGSQLWSINLCSDADFGQLDIALSAQGRAVVSASGVLAPYCLGQSLEASLLSLDSDGLMEWCAPLGVASSPRLDALGNAFVIDGPQVKAFDSIGRNLWKDSDSFQFSPRFLEGLAEDGSPILSDLGERLVVLNKNSGTLTASFTPLYQECFGKRVVAVQAVYSYSLLQGAEGAPYYYLSECNLRGEVKNIRRWLESDLRLVDVVAGPSGVWLGGSLALPKQDQQYPYLQQLSLDLKG